MATKTKVPLKGQNEIPKQGKAISPSMFFSRKMLTFGDDHFSLSRFPRLGESMWEQISFTGFINVFNRRATDFQYLI